MIRTPVGQSQHLLLGDVIGKQRTVMPLHHKLIAAAITHHMSLHTIAHEQVTHLWLQVHLLGIRILSYRHTYSSLFILHSSFIMLHRSLLPSPVPHLCDGQTAPHSLHKCRVRCSDNSSHILPAIQQNDG